MDFLDPKRKKSHRKRLFMGYLLMGVAIAMATWLMLVTARGFWYDQKTGDIIQNGTIFVDSQPVSAKIYLNGSLQGNRTSTRLVLPGSKQYVIKLTADGYRDWSRTFTLTGGSIERLVYPQLIPKTLTTIENQLYASAPELTTQSLDKHWLLVQQPGQTYTFDVYDMTNLSAAPTTLTIPSSILTDPTKPSTLAVAQWSNDNHHLLMKRTYADASEYLMIDINNIASSLNINTTLTVAPTNVTLRDNKADQLYLYDAPVGVVRIGDLKNRTVSGAVLTNALSYTSYGPDLLLYATKTGADTGKVDVRIRENDKASYLLKTLPESTTYLLDINQFDGTPYYIVGATKEDALFVYNDPLPTLKGQQNKALLIPTIIRLAGPQFVSFSPDSHLIAAQSGNKFIVYDIEGDRQFKVSLNHPVDQTQKIDWIDSFHFGVFDQNKSYVVDFDGSNEQPLIPSNPYEMFFSPDKKSVATIAPSKTVTGRFSLTLTSLVKK